MDIRPDVIILELDADDKSYEKTYPPEEYIVYACRFSNDRERKLVHLARKGYKGELLQHYFDYEHKEPEPFDDSVHITVSPFKKFKTIQNKTVEGSYRIISSDDGNKEEE